MPFTPLEKMETVAVEIQQTRVPLANYGAGIHCTPQAFFKKEADGTVPWVITRVCDHAGGVLLPSTDNASTAYCPLHHWEFDFTRLRYSKIPHQPLAEIEKKPLPFAVENNVLTYASDRSILRIPESLAPDPSHRTHARLRRLAPSSLMLEIDGTRIIADPRFMGESATNDPTTADRWALLENANCLFISHTDPTHLPAETLAPLRRDMPIMVPKSSTHAVSTALQAMGFTQVHELKLKRLYRFNNSDLLLCILPAGDYGEGSALFVASGDFSCLMTFDCAGANQSVLPENITLLLTRFSAESSGSHQCDAQNEALKYIATTRPKAYMPDGGFLEARAITSLRARYPDMVTVDPQKQAVIEWRNGEILINSIHPPKQ